MALPPPAPDSTALVTGASAGIGREIARALAARGHGVTLVARRAERLEALAEELRSAHGIRAEAIPADLASPEDCEALVEEIGRRGLKVEILVNNAGFGIYGRFGSAPLDREFEQLAVLVGAPVDLTARLLGGMRERRRGTIVNISSTSAFQPLPGNANYAASKAFLLLHSEALGEEVRKEGITVTAVCPGPVRTEVQETSEPAFADRLPKFAWATPERVAADALRAAERGKRCVIPGGLPKRLLFGMNRRTPSFLSLPLARLLMSKDMRK
jgi:short-subunit dehydrogenase